MTNRLPLPISTLKQLEILISENSSNLWMVNPLRNVLRNIVSYDYADAIKGLEYLRQDFPKLMNYDKEVKAIQKAEKRYNEI